jgi:ABC-type sugar transport system ATPase subunit
MTESSIEEVPRQSEASGDVEVVDVSMRFGGVPALSHVSISIRQGEVHALVGENGAG